MGWEWEWDDFILDRLIEILVRLPSKELKEREEQLTVL